MHLLAVCAPAQDVVVSIQNLIADVGETHFLQRKAAESRVVGISTWLLGASDDGVMETEGMLASTLQAY
jgi:hypothetical protein